MLNEFNEGGTHEQNPLGGIPMGVGSNGKLNTVEENETMKGDFVYSNRIMITPQMIAQFNLPKNLEGKSVADATKLINKKFEGRNSKIDNSTKKNFLDRIAQAQEAVKAEEEAKQAQIAQSMEANSTEVPDMMNGQIPPGMEEFTNQNQMYGGGFADKNQMSIDQPFQGGNTDFNNMSSNTSGNTGGGSGMNYGQLGNMIGGLGTAIAPGGVYGKQQVENEQAGFYDKKLASDQRDAEMVDKTKDTVASAIGPMGQLFRGIQKAGQGVGNAIGGESGAAVSGAFSPEEATISNFKNDDLNVGEKLLGTVPGVGAVLAHRSAQKRAEKFASEKRTREYYDKYIRPTEDFSGVNINAFGGNLTDSVTDPKKTQTSTLTGPITSNTDPTLQRINNDAGIQSTKEGANTTFKQRDPNQSRFREIAKIQSGVSDAKLGSGYYYYYKDPSKGDFNPETDRDFVSSKNHNVGLRSLDVNLRNNMLDKYYAATGGKENRFAMYKYGGKINQYRKGGPFDKNYSLRTDDPNYTSTPEEGTLTNAQFTNDLVNQFNNRGENIRQFGQNVNPHNEDTTQSNIKPKFNLGEKLSNIDGSFLRYAPIGMNAFQLATLGGPDVERLGRLNNQYQRQFLDEKAYENIARQQAAATTNAIGRSGISGGQLVNAQLASQLNKTKAVSEAYNQMRQHNIGENKMRQQVDFANNQANLQQSNLENDINARNKGAFNTERSRLLGQMGTDSGNVGKEETYKKLAKEAFGYTWDGKYVRNNKGEVVKNPDTGKPMTKEDLDKAKQYSEKFNSMKSLKFSPLNLNTKK